MQRSAPSPIARAKSLARLLLCLTLALSLVPLQGLHSDAYASEDTTGAQAAEEFANSWRYANGALVANATGEAETANGSSLGLLSTTYPHSTWKKSYGASYLGIATSSTTTKKVAISGAARVVIDVSKWQGDINWTKVADAGVTAAIVRCAYGTSTLDEYFVENMTEAIDAGIEVGVYLYSTATTAAGAKKEAAVALGMLEEAGLNPSDLDLPVFLDMESSTQAALTAAKRGNIAKAFCTAVAAEGYEVGIYANLNWWTNYLTASYFNTTSLYKWVARYPTGTGVTDCGVSDADLWQFTSQATIPGITENTVDVSFDYLGSGQYTAKPAAVTLNSATVADDYSSVALEWTRASNATGYKVYRSTDGGSTFTRVKTISSNSTLTWTDSTVEVGKSYVYRVRAYRIKANDDVVYGSYSSTLTALTKPAQVSVGSASIGSGLTSVALTWSQVDGAAGYQVRRSVDGGAYELVASIDDAATTSYSETGLSPAHTYRYKVRAWTTLTETSTTEETTTDQDTGEEVVRTVTTETTTTVYGSYSAVQKLYMGPANVTVSSAKTTTGGNVKVTWKKAARAQGYVVYRSLNGGAYKAVKTIESATKLTWTDSSVKPGRVYRYKVRAYTDATGASIYSAAYSSAKKVTAKLAKAAITSVSSTAKASGTVKWKKVANAGGYQVAYRIKGTSTWHYTTVKTNKKTFTSLRNKSYYVKVRAYKTYNGKKYYGTWSSQKLMTVK